MVLALAGSTAAALAPALAGRLAATSALAAPVVLALVGMSAALLSGSLVSLGRRIGILLGYGGTNRDWPWRGGL